MMQPHAVIFDLDGTLVDSLVDIARSLNHALTKLGQDAVDARFVRGWIGDGLPALCMRAAQYVGDESMAPALLTHARAAYETGVVANTRCFPNVLEMLDLLRIHGVPMAVLSNKPDALAQRVIDALSLRDYFTACVGYQSEADRKPSPVRALQLAEQMRVGPGRVMIVGDSVVDIATARNAGLIAGAVAWGFQDVPALLAAAPDYFFQDPLEIFSAVRGKIGPDGPPVRAAR